MSDGDTGDIAVLSINENVARDPVDDVQDKIDRIWRSLAASPDVVERLGSADPARPPVAVGTREARFGVVESIVISVVAGLSRDAATWLWKEKIWPLLKQQMGDDVKEA